jgi:ankyrin repeat protein
MRYIQRGGDFNDFIQVCITGNLLEAQEYLRLNPDTDISAENELAFRSACHFGKLDVAQWLLEIKPDINISAKNNFAFEQACYNGHLDVAKWLYQVSRERGQPIDISVDDNRIFYYTCHRQRLNVAKWLASLNPAYEIIDEDKPNWRCNVLRDPKKIKWNKNKNLVKLASGEQGDNIVYRMPTDVVRITANYL